MNGNYPDDKIVFEARVKALEASAKLWAECRQTWSSNQVLNTAAVLERWLLRPREKSDGAATR